MPGTTHAYRIRPADTDDCERLADWACAMALETEHKQLDASIVRAGVAAGIADPQRARYLIAMRDAIVAGGETIGLAVGTLMVTCEWSDWRNGDWWWIQSVYVPPAQRRQGVFAALYAHIRQLALDTPGVVGLRLYVERDNAAAQATYAGLGMVDAGYRIFEAPLR